MSKATRRRLWTFIETPNGDCDLIVLGEPGVVIETYVVVLIGAEHHAVAGADVALS